MKQYNTFPKKFINFFVFLVLVIGKVTADDCAIVKNAINLMGGDLQAEYEKSNVLKCCEYKQVISCDGQNNVTEM